ncbi:carboxypeptidase regulatory-like domain-containing protein [Methylomonas sp. HW2-6]|uniref:carboxypeptidase regulatory-like domain-containing protein n=1 Tax=Methylomonas sp. HW2-6 TaxID=3376687 RepID=UPI0040425E26
MKKRYTALMIAWFLHCISAGAGASSLEEQNQGDVGFISGGVGIEERAALNNVRTDYNLSLLFSSQDSGEYFSGVSVRISDGNGRIVLDTVSAGPILFAKLKPGRYRVSADHEGQTIRKSVAVDGKHRAALGFAWPDR